MSADTPLMQQYKKIKEEYKNEILMFRLGDFYEMFFEDAKTASKELGLTLTKRNREKGQDVPLAGVPYHSVASYIAKLVEKGYSIAICDQVEDPKSATGIVKREVTRVITPGTIIDVDFLDKNNNNYIACIKINTTENIAAIAYADITTGEFSVFEIKGKNFFEKALAEMNKIQASEILLDEKTYSEYIEIFKEKISFSGVKFTEVSNVKKAENFITSYFNIMSVEVFSLKSKDLAISTSANLLHYIDELQKGNDLPFSKIEYKNIDNIMELNISTQNNLNLVPKRNEETRGTLLGVLDNCITSVGSRELKKIIKNPFLNIEKIKQRQFYVDYFYNDVLLRESIREYLKDIYDIERIAGKIIYGTENGKDLLSLKDSIRKSLEIYRLLKEHQEIKDILDIDVKILLDIYNKIELIINIEAPFSVREGGIIKDGYNSELDELRKISKLGKDFILEIEQRERERTGIKGLKIKYNKVFGYFIEVTKANEHLVPEDYIRKQTLVNSERYIVPDLKEYEEKVITAKSKIEALEYELFKQLTSEIKEHIDSLYKLANRIANLDIVSNFAHIATKNSYVKPEMNEGEILEIKGGRHPIVETLIPSGTYVKNDIILDDKNNLIILTGPNMSGKSTYMKQVALNIIMAHIGSYVAADYAKIPIVDKIFTRVGASDDLLTGQSTFMLEMTEVASILNSATKKSFVVLDEIGRGTSTYDGISIATAITEYIHNIIGAKTIFATHYHELTELEKELERAINFRVEVKEDGKNVVFLREIVKGGADKSYGIEVARLSGVPKEVLNRSRKILKKLETRKNLIENKIKAEQMMLFGTGFEEDFEEEETEILSENEVKVLDILKNMDLNSMSPLESLLKLNELKKILIGGTDE
ncbi:MULTISPECIES: DNA mismatch repair protein MutS [Fusobacterium]|uniref:DNA mismatch repair protein MutS n=1 Tax=Fusobacterium nucleatum TaxID=851 RepID=A0A323TS91_FUSNU|nr:MULTISPECIES: DNA mismatch repair protein MutS [Fusobacterium]PCR84614.1 DNA mismatch repair protein MutS [Fusobacterium nucleatum]PZA03465.1 DNA mismatch repair protein MutS [Fusobacterium nucleatum]QJX50852.1 DNA mismatch repair protein MutS [Fusobacterium nucleatum]BEO98472.1 DNA mismatch repair protein MutS [Fusobacterium nucleatum]BEP09864.1 DNA mismatch repair protein MutS [Fusobacterium nucleatum]